MSFSCANSHVHASFAAAIDANKYAARSAPAIAPNSQELIHTMSSRKKSLLATIIDVDGELQAAISPHILVG